MKHQRRDQVTERRDWSQPAVSLHMLAKRARSARMKSNGDFPRHVFRDTARDILLEIFISQEEGSQLCVKQLMAAASETSTGIIRRLHELESAGLTARRPDSLDHRRTVVVLTEKGREAVALSLLTLFDGGSLMNPKISSHLSAHMPDG